MRPASACLLRPDHCLFVAVDRQHVETDGLAQSIDVGRVAPLDESVGRIRHYGGGRNIVLAHAGHSIRCTRATAITTATGLPR